MTKLIVSTRSIGNVVKELKAQEVYENTIIVIIADNGRPFVRSKLYTYDSGMRVPFIVHWKGGIKQAGTVSKSLVSTIDLAPTFLEAAGITIEGTTFQGRSLIPLLQEDSSAANHPFIVTERNHHIWEAQSVQFEPQNSSISVTADLKSSVEVLIGKMIPACGIYEKN